MDIEIKNEAGALNVCSAAKDNYIKQLNSEISLLRDLLYKIKSNWQSTGVDKESYVVELEKQINNLDVISDNSYKFFDAIYRYVSNSESTSKNTVGGTGVGGTVSTAANAVGNAARNLSSSLSSVASNISKPTSSTPKTSSSTAGVSTARPSTYSNSSFSGYSNSGTSFSTSSSGYVNRFNNAGEIVGNDLINLGTTTNPDGVIGTGSGISTIVESGGNNLSSLAGWSNVGSSGKSGYLGNGSVSSGTSGTTTSVSRNSNAAGSVSGALSSKKSSGFVPKMSVPSSMSDANVDTSGKVVIPVLAGGASAAAISIGSIKLLNKNKKQIDSLKIDAWDGNVDESYMSGTATAEVLTLDDEFLI